MAQKITGITPAAGVTLQAEPTKETEQTPVPFRRASQRKDMIGMQQTTVQSAIPQPLNHDVEGTGYLDSVDLDVVVTSAGNGNAVTVLADAPWNVLQEISFKAIGPELITLSGYDLFLANLYGGFGINPGLGAAPTVTADPMVCETPVLGAGGTGGSYRFTLRLPMALNARSMLGILGNQDQGTKYSVRKVIAPIAAVYNQAPTNAPTINVNSYYNYMSIPAPSDNFGRQQEQVPPAYGVLHLVNSLRSEAAVLTGTTSNHYLRQLGNTSRVMILVWRLANGARSDLPLYTLATHTDARITFRVGDDVIFSESASHRRKIMWDRYGFDAPAGVLVYDFISDFSHRAGFELGDDYLNTQNIPNAQFEVQYPAFAGGPAALQIISDQIVIPAGLMLDGQM
jgi:hypothetical protein